MINENNVKHYCKGDISLIENYQQAVNDDENMWQCHHRLGEVFTTDQLIAGHNYYSVEPECLIFLTRNEHRERHKKHKTNTFWRGRKLIQRKNK